MPAPQIKGLANLIWGAMLFMKQIRNLIGRAARLGNHGGDRKSKDYNDQAG